MNLIHKLFLTLLVGVFLAVPTASQASAAYTPPTQTDINKVDCSVFKNNSSVWGAINNPRWVTDTATSAIVGPAYMSVTGTDFGTGCECAKAAATTTDLASKNAVANSDAQCKKVQTYFAMSGLGVTSKLALGAMDAAQNLVSPKYYASNIMEDSPLFKTAHAADYWAIQTILANWKTVRVAVYEFSALGFVVIGFMIMFRKKMDPQTVVTLQNALPGIVLALVLITFSYPIAAIILKISDPAIALVQSWFPQVGGIPLGDSIVLALITTVVPLILLAAGAFAAGAPPVSIALAVIALIMAIAFLFAFVYMGWVWITRIGKIIFLVLLAPFILLAGAIPGNDKTAINWFKSLISLSLQFAGLWFVIMLGISLINNVYGIGYVPILGIIAGPILGTYVLYQVGKVPKLIDTALGVEPLFGDSGAKKGGKR